MAETRPASPREDRLLTWRQVADQLQVSRATVFRLAKAGRLGQLIKINTSTRFRQSALEAYIASVATDPNQ